MARYAVPATHLIFALALSFLGMGPHFVLAQPIVLEDCATPYVDPQDGNNQATSQNRDTLVYTQFFDTEMQAYRYWIDVNAFGGQQVDRVKVQAILPDNSTKDINTLAFGACATCTEGFALSLNDSLAVSGVATVAEMELWLEALGQPPFALTGNLQTLSGVGRLSGVAPFCAIGLRVEYSVYSDPNNASTEFATYIHCPEPVSDCQFEPVAIADCVVGQIQLGAEIPEGCFQPGFQVSWANEEGDTVALSPDATLPLQGQEGWYYFTAADECCLLQDSFLLDNPQFAEAGEDLVRCADTPLLLAGEGGQGHFWTLPGGGAGDSLLIIPVLEAADSGQYILHAFNEQGCADTDTLQLDILTPPSPIVEQTEGCLGDTIFLLTENAADYESIQWFSPQEAPLPFAFLPGFQAFQAGTYRVEATDSEGCVAKTGLEVMANALPEPELFLEETCDTAYAFFSPEAYRYSWPEGDGLVLATATGGVFPITVTDSLGCTLAWEVAVPEPNGPEVQLLIDQPYCPGDKGALEIVLHSEERQAIFSIDGGETYTLADRFRNLDYGPYEVVIRDALDCVQRFEIDIIPPDTLGVALNYAPITVRPTTPVSLVATTVGAVARYQWVPGEIDTGGPAVSFIANRNMDIRVIVEDERGCRASAALPLTVVVGEVYAPSAFSPDGNGINDRFTLYSDNGSGELMAYLRVFDRWGGLIFEAEGVPLSDERYGWDGTRNGEPLNTGTYTYQALVQYPNGFVRELAGLVHLSR